MRAIRFPKYEKGKTSTEAQAWVIMWLAVTNHPAGNREQTLCGRKLLDELGSIGADLPGDAGKALDPKGGELVLEDAEFRLLGQAIDGFRANLRLGSADALLWLDNVLEKAPVISKEAYKRQKRAKGGPSLADGG